MFPRVKLDMENINDLRGPSPAIWKNLPIEEIVSDRSKGVFHFDDFCHMPLIGTQTTQIGWDKYKVFATASGSVAPVSAVNSVEKGKGILAFLADTDNDSASLADAYPSYLMSGLASNSGKLAFEACIAVSSIATNGIGFMLGLAEVEQWTLATGVPFNGGDAITNAASFIGFRSLEDQVSSAKTIDSVYSDRATSFTNIQATIASMTANTFVKLGLLYDPKDAANCVRFFVDGVETSTPMTRSTLTGLTNLDANALGLIAAIVADSAGTAINYFMDWWQVAQLAA